MHLVLDVRDWFDEHGNPIPQLRRRALRIARLIEYGGTLKPGEVRLTLVECSRRPKRRDCEGLLWVTKTKDDHLSAWCPHCDQECILITGWADTVYAEGPPEPLPALPPVDASALN